MSKSFLEKISDAATGGKGKARKKSRKKGVVGKVSRWLGLSK